MAWLGYSAKQDRELRGQKIQARADLAAQQNAHEVAMAERASWEARKDREAADSTQTQDAAFKLGASGFDRKQGPVMGWIGPKEQAAYEAGRAAYGQQETDKKRAALGTISYQPEESVTTDANGESQVVKRTVPFLGPHRLDTPEAIAQAQSSMQTGTPTQAETPARDVMLTKGPDGINRIVNRPTAPTTITPGMELAPAHQQPQTGQTAPVPTTQSSTVDQQLGQFDAFMNRQTQAPAMDARRSGGSIFGDEPARPVMSPVPAQAQPSGSGMGEVVMPLFDPRGIGGLVKKKTAFVMDPIRQSRSNLLNYRQG
jgi:hypothetical protein